MNAKPPINETEPCPVCAEPVLKGFLHEACMQPGNTVATIEDVPGMGTVISFGPGTTMQDVMAFIMGNKPLYGRAEQFDWTHTDGSMSLTLNVSALNQAISKAEVEFITVETPLDEKLLSHLVHHGDINARHVMDMSQKRMLEPVIFIEAVENEDKWILADGQHRYVAHMVQLETMVTAYMLPYRAWQPFGKVTIHQAPDTTESSEVHSHGSA